MFNLYNELLKYEYNGLKELFKMAKTKKIRDYYQFRIFNFRRNLFITDKTIVCRDCWSEFIVSVGEQEFYKEKGVENELTRCMSCRRAKK